MTDSVTVPADELRDTTAAAARELGLSPEDAATAADHLVEADLWGRRSHGVSTRFDTLRHIMENPERRDSWRIHRDEGSSVTVDGGLLPGYVVGTRCTDLAVERARRHGTATVTAYGMTHTGMLGYYAARGAGEDMVMLVFGNCVPLMAPTGSRDRFFGSNPLAFGFPGPDHPVVTDLATSAVSMGAVKVAEERGEKLPPGAMLDENGRPTEDPSEGEVLLPVAAGKGSALAFAVQAMSICLSGATPIPGHGHDYGFAVIALDPENFAGIATLRQNIKTLIDRLHELEPTPDGSGARAPGERAFAEKKRLLDEGIEVDREVWAEIRDLAGK